MDFPDLQKMFPNFVGIWCLFLGIISFVHSKTDSSDVSALNVMYTSLNSPDKLTNWKSSGGDPCGQDWTGITCSDASVVEIRVSGLGLTGSLGYQLSSLSSVTYFDVSQNNIKGDIPYQLPPNVIHLDLSSNGFTGGIPYSISQMTDVTYLNFAHNQLSGQVTDMFSQLRKLDSLDFSYNMLTGNLPQTFGSLSSLSTLYLENNQFTGPVDVLAKLKLDDLNLANNHFNGWIPTELTKVKKIEVEGNSWSSGPAPPGMTSSDKISSDGPSNGGVGSFSGAVIAVIILGILLGLAIVVALLARKRSSFTSNLLDEHESFGRHKQFNSFKAPGFSNDSHGDMCIDFKDGKSLESSTSIDTGALQSSRPIGLTPAYSSRINSFRNTTLANMNLQRSSSFRATCYGLTDLQAATGSFATGRLLGEGTIGRVYRAKFADGKVLAVKKIDSSFFQGGQAEKFSVMVSNIFKLHHPNIVPLVGYCSEQGHNMLVYEYFRNGSLHEFLHLSDEFSRPLTWNTRVRIALGTARAVEYLHEICSPPLTHKNIKSSNILLDVDLNPRLSECGLVAFYQQAGQNLGAGYNPPECTKPSDHTFKSDVYSFGVVMLELLTGRMPFDSSKPRSEQHLVQWATPQLHNIDALEKMVDPALRGLYPPKSISRFADIVALCVQIELEFRPPMSEVVQSLVRLVQRSSMNKRGDDIGGSRRMDEYDY
ncbi:hypothetical protein Nepgr_005725 [Nepenthes gracilis]|uniref:Protein kinase domain-containing protein n=1 Tax=Nepenthes gracilis TaxID=150966 RepID=A0AAD3XGV7_NEPGR|nr:hypothetical protein Nepgr_005725 [Nepenthes gracilis]